MRLAVAAFALIFTSAFTPLTWGPQGWQNSRLAPGFPLASPATLNGSWTGMGQQRSTRSTWDMTLTVWQQDTRGYTYAVDYPSLACGGYWTFNSEIGTFTEHIVYGRDNCVDLGRIWVGVIGNRPVDRIDLRWTGRQRNGYPESAVAMLTRVQ